MGKFIDLSGQKFSRLLVLSVASRGKKVKWLCKCSCGNETLVVADQLKSGHTKSCGCLQKEKVKITGLKNKKHGYNGSKELNALSNAIGRCYNKNDSSYEEYGGRGITVCKEWRENTVSFLNDMGTAPSGNFSLDRIDNNLGYSKDNCRWASWRQQNHNKRKRKGCTSQFIGVCWSVSCMQWEAKIRNESGVQEHLGYFTNEIEAAIAYDEISFSLFGDRPNSSLINEEQYFTV